MARGLPPYKSFRLKFVRGTRSLAGVFRRSFIKSAALELVDPGSGTKIYLLLKGPSVRFYYEASFGRHYRSVETYEFGVTSNQYLDLWTHYLNRWGSDLGPLEGMLEPASDKQASFAYAAALVCRNSGTPCPEKLSEISVDEFHTLIKRCKGLL